MTSIRPILPACLLGCLLPAILLLASPAPADTGEPGGFPDDRAFARLWKDMARLSEKAAELGAGEAAGKPTFLETITARRPRYVRLLQDAGEILGGSEAGDLFRSLNRLRARNIDLGRETAALKRERLTAPAESRFDLVDQAMARLHVAKTKRSIDARLQAIAAEIAENTASMADLQQEICASLGRSGFRMSPEEVGYFVISAEGDELFHLILIAGNMRKMQRAIEAVMREDPDNVELARSYAGMYMISLDAYAAAHDTAISRIAGCRGRIAGIIDGAVRNMQEARSLKRRADAADARNLDANIRINEQAIGAARMYDSLLERRTVSLGRAREALALKADMAKNTYRTLVNGSSLISLVSAASSDFRLLADFEMPELRTIYDTAMLNAFTDIAEKIRQEK